VPKVRFSGMGNSFLKRKSRSVARKGSFWGQGGNFEGSLRPFSATVRLTGKIIKAKSIL